MIWETEYVISWEERFINRRTYRMCWSNSLLTYLTKFHICLRPALRCGLGMICDWKLHTMEGRRLKLSKCASPEFCLQWTVEDHELFRSWWSTTWKSFTKRTKEFKHFKHLTVAWCEMCLYLWVYLLCSVNLTEFCSSRRWHLKGFTGVLEKALLNLQKFDFFFTG
jgi:hypothetical protein